MEIVYVPTKHLLTFTGLHDVISPKIELLTVTAVRTSTRRRNALIRYQGSKEHYLHGAEHFLKAEYFSS
jgi:hypothetical protein